MLFRFVISRRDGTCSSRSAAGVNLRDACENYLLAYHVGWDACPAIGVWLNDALVGRIVTRLSEDEMRFYPVLQEFPVVLPLVDLV